MKPAILLLGLWLASTLSMAQNTQSNTQFGIRYMQPPGWTSTAKEDEILLGSDKLEGFILIRTAPYKSLKKMKVSMEAGVEKEPGTTLELDTELLPYGPDAVAGLYHGQIDGAPVKGFLIGKYDKESKKSVLIIVVAPEARFNQSHMDAVKTIGRTLSFL